MALRPASRSIAALGILALIGAGLGALTAPVSALPAPPPAPWPANNSQVPAGIGAIQIILSGGMGGGNFVACQVTSSQRVQPGDSVSWILGADGAAGIVSSGSVEAGGAGGLGAYGFSGAAGGNSSTFTGAKSGGGGGGASAFEVNGVARIVVGGSGGSGAYAAGACQSDGSSGFLSGALNGLGVVLASSLSDVVAGGLGGSVSGQPGLPGAPGNPSTGAGAGEGGIGGNDNASTPWSTGGGGGGGGGFAGGGGGVGASASNLSGHGAGGGNMVEPSPYTAAPVFEGGPSQQAAINWVHISNATLTAARAGVPYRATPTATFGSATSTTPLAADTNAAWIVDGTGVPLPDGLQLNTTTGEISGKATTPGSYSFRLIAAQHEDGGMVAFSKATFNLTVLPAIAPDAPRSVTATTGNASAVVNWIKPTSDGGSAISKYIVRQSPGGAVCTITTPAPLTCDISGLANGTSYTFTVVAINAVGTSDPSNPSAAVVPQASRQRQIVQGVPLPSELTRTGGNVLLKRSTFTSSGQPVHVQVSVTPLLRARPAGDLELYRMVTGVNGSKTLYITTSQRVSVTVTLYAASSRGYLKWTKARAYSL
ncbi:MAG: fibronectin type III domain-containing protein [Actinobacteria bacterium]|nr:fibronectin type III domain-containing protein [Actinomycetota bacterium]